MTDQEFERERERLRAEREQKERDAQRRQEVLTMPIKDLCLADIGYITYTARLTEIIRCTERRDILKAAMDRVYRLDVYRGLDTIQSCLPGNFPLCILKYITDELRKTYIFIRWIINS